MVHVILDFGRVGHCSQVGTRLRSVVIMYIVAGKENPPGI